MHALDPLSAAEIDTAVATLRATLQDAASTYFSFDTKLGQDVTVGPHVVFGPGVKVEDGAEIRAFSHLENCHVGEAAQVGPYARLRPGEFWALDEPFTNLDQTGRAWLGRRCNDHLAMGGLLLMAAHQESLLDPSRETVIELQGGGA